MNSTAMKLTPEEVDFFYATWTPLLAFVNERKRIFPGLVFDSNELVAPESAVTVRDALWAETSLLDDFLRENPAGLSADGLALASSWRHHLAGTFILYKPMKSHMIVLHDVRPVEVFGVHGLRTPLDEMVPWLPCMVKGVLLPFGDRIVFDGLLSTYSVHFGPGIRSQFAWAYRAAKGRVITRLGPPSAEVVTFTTAGTSKAPATPSTKTAKTTGKKKKSADEKTLTNPGRCEGCGELFSKRVIGRHVAECEALHAVGKGKAGPRYRLVVESPGMPEYWLQVEVGAATTLRDLDGFLRNIWLECCGHMSAFKIAGMSFASSPDKSGWGMRDERSMGTKIGELVDVPSWGYEYDFGSTTALRVRPAGTRVGASKGVRLLARNLPPMVPCVECGAPSKAICTECRWEDGGWLCAKCAKKHKCGDDLQLPVVNSPRTGECGYTG